MSLVADSQDKRCKGCGLFVQPGYAKCPRCKMPQHATPAERKKAQGGTAVAGGSNRATYVALALLGVVIAVVLVSRDGSDAPSTTPTATRTSGPGPTTAAPTTTAPQNTTRPANTQVGFTGTEDKVDDAEKGRQAVLRTLEEALSVRRLWASVSTDRRTPTVVDVSSATCSDGQMKATLGSVAEQLKSAGFTSLRCVEKHGALVFELKF